MRIIAVIILIFGAAIAGGAVFLAKERYSEIEALLARQAQEAKPADAAPQIKTSPVVVAAKPMSAGQFVVPGQLKVVQFPEGAVPPNAFSSIEELVGDGRDKRSVLRSIEPNEPILKAKVTDFGERATISAQLTPGMRAFTLKIDSVSGVAGFLLPNDNVDVFLTRGNRDGVSADLILQNVKVIAVDQFSNEDSNKARVARTVTVEVTREDAQRLALAQQVGKITLSLRQVDEEETVAEAPTITLEDVVKLEKPKEEVVVPKKAPVCVRRAGELICN